jgi:hypothetical protein
MQNLINITFYESTSIIFNVNFIQIINALIMKYIVTIHELILKISILELKRSINHRFSFIEEFLSCFFNDKFLFTIN